MSVLGDAQAAVETAARTVAEIRVFALGEQVTPPGVVVGPPRLDPLSHCAGPSTAVFPVNVVVALGDRSVEQLYELVPAVWEAIEENSDAVVTTAVPGTYNNGAAGELPAYELTVEHPI